MNVDRQHIQYQQKIAAVIAELQFSTIKRTFLFAAIGFYVQNYSSFKSKCTKTNENTYFSNFYVFLCSRGIYFCDEVTLDHMVEYKNQLLKNNLSASTVNRQFRTFRHFFNTLVKSQKIYRSPCQYLEPEKEQKPIIELWTGRDFIKARKGVSHSTAQLMTFLWMSGARSCEAVNLMWTDIDWNRAVIYLRTGKTGQKIREIEITKRIDKLLHTMTMTGVYVFSKDGKKYTSDSLGKEVKTSILSFCKNKKLDVKSIRHTYCTRGIERGLSNKTVQSLMGHSSWRTTEKYSHLSKKFLKQSAECL
jgi:integrase/recombinase XerD